MPIGTASEPARFSYRTDPCRGHVATSHAFKTSQSSAKDAVTAGIADSNPIATHRIRHATGFLQTTLSKLPPQTAQQVQLHARGSPDRVLTFVGNDRAGRSLSAMCEEQDALLDNLLPLDIRQVSNAFSCRMPRGIMPTIDLLQGTLDLLILRTLALESMHGWGIAQRIQQVSKDALQIGQGSLYPALHRLEYKGWIQAEWGASENNRKAKYYSLTKTGRKQLQAELEDWGRISTAIALVLK